ncbi:MAG: hypothetical protein H7Y41_04530, partial [Hyphomonadaceae bacterium]|nr:hypothetical protein [Clostridia bacterium]
AMIAVHEALKSRKLRSHLILQVHDELIVETHREELEEVKKLLKDCMENAVKLAVPISVDLGVGESWYDSK